ncbi:MAG TPA: ABC transporter ATP-binding protein [Flavobacteriales bacterium]|nr:ABC transporter ATP-binding protein [Flavobacteriales bacterium]
MGVKVLELKNICIDLSDGKSLVKNASLSIEKGRVHGLIGESGSGKSLSALSIVGLLPRNCSVTGGSICLTVNGVKTELQKLPSNEIRSIRGNEVGFIFQDPMTSLNPVMRCGDQVEEAIAIHQKISKKELKKRVIHLFQKVKLPDPEKAYGAYPHELSGGQRQRVMIAQAISCNPALLVADEPTTALDVEVQMAIVDLINELRKSDNMAVLFISHDLGIISEIADDISIMYKGEIIETGTTEAIFKSPEAAYTKGLLACRPPLDKQINRLPTIQDFIDGIPREANDGDSRNEDLKENANEILLMVRALSAFYPLSYGLMGQVTREFHVLRNIDFEVVRGESLGLVGESGSGKSSLGRALLHLIETRSGEINYRGELISDMREKEFRKWRSKIQFVFQDPYSSLNPKIKVGEAINEVLKVHKSDLGRDRRKDKVHELLRLVGLHESDYDKYPHQFSGGQRQRIVIARALAPDPEFIVCDEAVSALDVSVQAQILNLLKDLKINLGLTYLFITHDMAVVRFFCDRMLVMKDGSLIESGKTDRIFEMPSHDYTKSLIEFAKKLG